MLDSKTMFGGGRIGRPQERALGHEGQLRLTSVFDPQQELAVVLPSCKPVVKRSPGAADMQ